jgi:hypothetical protein
MFQTELYVTDVGTLGIEDVPSLNPSPQTTYTVLSFLWFSIVPLLPLNPTETATSNPMSRCLHTPSPGDGNGSSFRSFNFFCE